MDLSGLDSRSQRRFERLQRSYNARTIQRTFRNHRRLNTRRNMQIVFMLNPCEKELDLTNKEDLKLCENTCKGVNNFTFDGNIEIQINFQNLLGNIWKIVASRTYSRSELNGMLLLRRQEDHQR